MAARRDIELLKAYEMIVINDNDELTITDFLSIDLDKNLDMIQKDLRKEFSEKGIKNKNKIIYQL
jgi:hypothetical protein